MKVLHKKQAIWLMLSLIIFTVLFVIMLTVTDTKAQLRKEHFSVTPMLDILTPILFLTALGFLIVPPFAVALAPPLVYACRQVQTGTAGSETSNAHRWGWVTITCTIAFYLSFVTMELTVRWGPIREDLLDVCVRVICVIPIVAIPAGVYVLAALKKDPRARLRAGVLCCMMMLLLSGWFPVFAALVHMEKRPSAARSTPISSLRTLDSVQAIYITRYDTYASLAALCNAGLIDRILGAGNKSGYEYELEFDSNRWWRCTARPIEWSETNYGKFRIGEDGHVYWNDEPGGTEFTRKLGE